MRRFIPTLPADRQLIAELNITPLIDVMLVLLVMFILCVPALTNKLPIDLPQPGPLPIAEQISHELAITRSGALTLDGVSLDEAALATRLAALRDDPRSELVMRTDPEARYARFDETLAVVKRAGISRLGFAGNERMADSLR